METKRLTGVSTFGLSFLMLVIAVAFSACEKSVDSYENDPRIYFFERQNDLVSTRITSKSFSFLTYPSTVTRDTMLIKVKIMGLPGATDRIVRGEAIADGTTAIEGQHYQFIDGTIKAGAIIGELPVVLLRSEDIKNEAVTLKLRIAETADFKPGVAEDSSFSLTWNDNLIKPTNWDTGLFFYFGTYSAVKFRFVIDVLGLAEFPLQASARVPLKPGEFSNAAMLDFKARMKQALLEYNNTHTEPKKDENEQLVTFPL